jgi:two-component system, chemotaxis family, sensor kinase CheA
MSQELEYIGDCLNVMALESVTLEEGDIPGLGRILNKVNDLEFLPEKGAEPLFIQLLHAVKSYLEQLILGEAKDTNPLGEGIGCLQKIYRSMSRGQPYVEDISLYLKQLNSREFPLSCGGSMGATDVPSIFPDLSEEVQEISDEDRQILSDFVVESLDNLASIEVSLIDLEQDPEDLETINAIFRPFHTIKGVSGFLDLRKINQLSHSAENLLDKARNGEIKINETIIDVILESLDMVRKMIEGVREALEKGGSLDRGVETGPLIEKIDEIISTWENVGDKPIGTILVEKGMLEESKVLSGLEAQKKTPGKKLGEILLENGSLGSKEVISALREQKKFGRRGIDLQVKVDTKKLDTLVDMTGELVIAQSILRQNGKIRALSDQKLYHTLNQLNQITSTLQKTAMSLRMVPIKSTFQKMVRLVRDLCKNFGKEVSLEMYGEDTEIDRNVVEELYEPMVHMIRNAIDHGIESPSEREQKGKSAKGVIILRAYHRGGNIVIEIEDDGKGLDKNRILEKARAKNLIGEEVKPTDSEVYNLIFQPGFSTAKVVTDISGRGVGMDVVKKAIERLRGRIEINARPGQGSTFVISLPLTLAIIEGMLVRVGKEKFIIPALSILESFRPTRAQYSTVKERGELILVRGKLIPLVRLDRLFGMEGESTDPWDGLVVAVEYEGRELCLVLDELLGKEEVVIKSLGESLKRIKGLAGGAILGDGRVGLILDMAGIFEMSNGF